MEGMQIMSEKILVVDDEKEIADLIEVYLKNDGYTVYKFYNGTDALKCVGNTEIDLAILDVMLPDVVSAGQKSPFRGGKKTPIQGD